MSGPDCLCSRLVCMFMLVAGIVCFILGAVVVALDMFASQLLATFFVADVTQELEEVYSSKFSLETIYERNTLFTD